MYAIDYRKQERHREMETMAAGEIFWMVAPSSVSGTTTVRLIACEIPGIFSKVVGVLTLNHFNILNAKSYREKNKSYHIFDIQPLPGIMSESQRLEMAHRHLDMVVSGKLDLSAQVATQRSSFENSGFHTASQSPPQVIVDNDRSALFSVVQVAASDFPGLLFSVTDMFFKHGVHIDKAEISTKNNEVLDIFYVKDSMGLKLTSVHKMSVLKAAIEKVLSQPIGGGLKSNNKHQR